MEMNSLTNFKKLRQELSKIKDNFFFKKVKSYNNLFSGKGTKEDAELVLMDLIKTFKVDKTSYQKEISNEEIVRRACLKKPIHYILDMLKYTDEDITNLIKKYEQRKD